MFVYGDSTYEIKYECGYFQTNHSRDSYLEAQGKSWDPASSYISAENFVGLFMRGAASQFGESG